MKSMDSSDSDNKPYLIWITLRVELSQRKQGATSLKKGGVRGIPLILRYTMVHPEGHPFFKQLKLTYEVYGLK